MKRVVGKILLWFLIIVAYASIGGESFGHGDPIARISQSHLYSFMDWEVSNLANKTWFQIKKVLPGSHPSIQERVQDVRRYFALTDQINGLRDKLNGPAIADASAVESQLTEIEDQRAVLQPIVEDTLQSMLGAALKSENLDLNLLVAHPLWPPFHFKMGQLPKLLIVSPRDKIEAQTTVLLRSDMTIRDSENIESAVAKRDRSGLVDDIGGLATYPSLLPDNYSLRSVLNIAAHEWTHQYLFFHSLGQHYDTNGDMTAINESVADMVGGEIGDRVYKEYFATPEELRPPPPPSTEEPDSSEPPPFNFNKEMRTTRLRVDELLGLGKIDEAESYMNERRQYLQDNGYYVRKLNQAYFAFHGNYADSPASVSPVGGMLQQLRNHSTSLGQFVKEVANFSSYDDLKRAVGILPN